MNNICLSRLYNPIIFFRFEKKPKHGVKFLQEKGLLGTTAADIAMFLYKEERLDKTAIGDYIGEGDE